jgi:hypothetical protein
MMLRHAAGFAVMLVIAGALNVSAEQVATPDPATPLIVSSAAIALAANDLGPTVTLASLARTAKRPTLLPSLYGTFATLQVLDVISTRKALAAGGHEANPLMRNGNLGTTIALKAASATATIYLTERLWKQNRVAAVVVMAAINGLGLAVVAHNSRIAYR